MNIWLRLIITILGMIMLCGVTMGFIILIKMEKIDKHKLKSNDEMTDERIVIK